MNVETRARRVLGPYAPAPTTGRRGRRYHRRETARHRQRVTILVAVTIALLYVVQELLWPRNPAPHGIE